MNNLNKIAFTVAMFFFCLILYSFISNIILNQYGFNKKEFLKPKPFQPLLERNIAKKYIFLEEELREVPVEKLTFSRNIFKEIKEVKAEPLFVLIAVKREQIPILFKGTIVRGDELIIAQINWGNKTHFVKPGESIDQWKVLNITKGRVQIEGADGEFFNLGLNQINYSKEFIADILVTKRNQIYHVKSGDPIAGYKVLNIQKEYVILSNNNSEITLNKK